MRFHIKSSSYHHYACTMSTMPIYYYRSFANRDLNMMAFLEIASFTKSVYLRFLAGENNINYRIFPIFYSPSF